jgi:dTDP-4-dehydrorhamnose 3,5-epimerase
MSAAFKEGNIEGIVIDRLKAFHDDRGWLMELFRIDDLKPEHAPAMGYISETLPGVSRGPHEHVDQTDIFIFMGPGEFRVQLWDNRPHSPTYRNAMTVLAGGSQPTRLIVPHGIVHGYKNISSVPALTYNFPNRLYKGHGRKEPVDEIRHEADVGSLFKME